MYKSLRLYTTNFHLYIVAFDDLSYKILTTYKFENVTVLPLKEFENPKLLSIKNSRTKTEYFWTCTSSLIEYCILKFNISACTYVDADIYFYKSPEILINEIPSNKDVMITEHGYSKFARLTEQKRAGRFCVQFITFKNTEAGRIILRKWIDQCIEWCFARYEDGKFGDQKYLDTWPEEYSCVYVLQNPGGGIAPWNVRRFIFKLDEGMILGTELSTKRKFEVVFFHFHYVRFINTMYADLGWNKLSQFNKDIYYLPYINRLLLIESELRSGIPEYHTAFSEMPRKGFRNLVKYFIKNTTKYNLLQFTLQSKTI